MDSFCEQLVKRKNTKKIIWIKFVVWAITLGLGIIVAAFFLFLAMKMGLAVLFVLAAIAMGLSIYMAIKFSRSLNIEYEYSFTNGCFDIDKIASKTNRTRLVSGDCKNIERYGKYRAKDHEYKVYNKTVTAYSVSDAPGLYYVVLRTPETGSILVVFEPNEASLEHIETFMPKNVLMDYKREEGIR